ncbi:MAG: hypothetical protein PHR83_16460 [Paludibacter sp.]|nr:hypothetical protein [Paludibacter sp.]
MKATKRKIDDEEIDFAFKSVGFQFPQTEKELAVFDNLYSEYEYKIKSCCVDIQSIINSVANEEKSNHIVKKEQSKKTYFKRVVLAAEIAKNLCNENTFGHVKFQKIMYLCEHAINMQLNENYCKQVAGPYDRKFMHSIDNELIKQNWFDVKQDKGSKYPKFIYTPLVGLQKQVEYYNNYFPNDSDIKYIIQLFKTTKTDYVELIATLYACILEINDSENDDSKILDKLYSWSVEKKKFSELQAREALKWMKEKGIYPFFSQL